MTVKENSETEKEFSWTIKDVEVSYKENDVTGKISLTADAYIKLSEGSETKNDTIEVVVKSFIANGKTYRPIELTLENVDGKLEITKASCDGIEINDKMLKAVSDMLLYSSGC